MRYGGNTSCVSIETADDSLIVLDCGTGFRLLGESLGAAAVDAHVFVTHLHWDHVQGLPFFAPLQNGGSQITLYGPGDAGCGIGESFNRFMTPPFFPVETGQLPASFAFEDFVDGSTTVGSSTVTARPVPHTGLTAGFRIERDGASVAYVPDHQQPGPESTFVDPAVLKLARGVDMLIHDAQYGPDEFPAKATWGHSTPWYALEVARQAEAKTLILFHHDPSHDDAWIDEMTQAVASEAAQDGIEVVAAAEGLKLSIDA